MEELNEECEICNAVFNYETDEEDYLNIGEFGCCLFCMED